MGAKTTYSTYDATFGLLWLEKHEPTIGYKAKTAKFEKCQCGDTGRIERQELSLRAMSPFHWRGPDSVLLAMVEISPKGEAKIPKEYKSFAKMFEEA